MLAAAVACAMTTLPAFAAGKEPELVFRKVSRSVVRIFAGPGQGSGVVIGRNTVVTNFHVVEDALINGAELRIKYPRQEKFILAHVLAWDKDWDLCILEANGLELPAVEIAPAVPPPGSRVYAVGAPLEHELTITDGLASPLRRRDDAPWLQTSAPISPGSSGGGLFDAQGRLVGITTSILAEADAHNLNYAAPAVLIPLVESRFKKRVAAAVAAAEEEKRSQELEDARARAAEEEAVSRRLSAERATREAESYRLAEEQKRVERMRSELWSEQQRLAREQAQTVDAQRRTREEVESLRESRARLKAERAREAQQAPPVPQPPPPTKPAVPQTRWPLGVLATGVAVGLAGVCAGVLLGGLGLGTSTVMVLARTTVGLQRLEQLMFIAYVTGWVAVIAAPPLAVLVVGAGAGIAGVGAYFQWGVE